MQVNIIASVYSAIADTIKTGRHCFSFATYSASHK